MGLSVRPPCEADRAQWQPLWQGYVDFYRRSVPDTVTEHTWSRILTPEGEVRAFVAEQEDGALAGFVHYIFHPSTWSLAGYCYLEDLFVAPEARGRGVGKALIEAVYDAADVHGATRVYWNTQQHNAAARRLYDRVASLSEFVQYRR